jgi:hypothetical protein
LNQTSNEAEIPVREAIAEGNLTPARKRTYKEEGCEG